MVLLDFVRKKLDPELIFLELQTSGSKMIEMGDIPVFE
jgi:hypothetical protein